MQNRMEIFALDRDEDESGVSGEGIVAYGVSFPDPNGKVVLAWMTQPHQSVAVYESMEAVQGIHGHGGKTQIIPIDSWDMGGP